MGRLGNVDPSSYSEPEKVLLKHVDLNWNVKFESQTIDGSATLQFTVIASDGIEEVLLDVSQIKISNVFIATSKGKNGQPLTYEITDHVPEIVSKLTITLPTTTKGELIITIEYETSPTASALQWLTNEQTLGKQHPYLFSQCQAIHARSIVPIQDTPAVKFTYKATVKHPKALTALMSAIRTPLDDETTRFEQTVPIPAYLLAIAVGALTSRPIGPISSVWAEKELIDAAASEFTDTDTFIDKASDICGEYVWKRYDLLVLPPSFPFGGMENPCLTFVTPTIIAGDKSLADVVAHEIAHSWTGNLVTNKNFEHFWLNEGFTVFVEGKIIGRIHGKPYRDFHALHNLSDLRDTLNNQLKDQPELSKLVVDLSNLGPDDAFSSVPYVKGSTFLRYLEDLFGGPDTFESFLRSYLNQFKFKSIETNDFKKALYDYFNGTHSEALSKIDWDLWLFGIGMPPVIPDFDKSVAEQCIKHSDIWATSTTSDIEKSSVVREKLTSTQIIEFLSLLLDKETIFDLGDEKIKLLEKIYNVHSTQNSEIRFRLCRLIIKARVFNRLQEVINFANSNFRMKFVRPVYRDLGNWPEAKPIAIDNFNKVKDQMMAVCSSQVAKDLGLI